MMESNRKIIHIDMDCYYAAVEMRENPDLIGKPIAVGGNSERGVLSTCNYEARQYGLHSAMSNYRAKQLCPQVIILSGNMALYKSISQQIRNIFSDYTDLVEPLSLDEAYLDVTDCTLFGGSATLIAEDIRKRIYAETQLTASAGVSVNKFIAKVASDFNKPNGICVVPPEKVSEFVTQLPVKAIPGVGKVMQKKLSELNIETCEQLKSLTLAELETRFGKMGGSLYRRARGICHRQVSNAREIKSTSVETTFAKDKLFDELSNELMDGLVERLNKRLEKIKKPIVKLQVKLKFADFMVKSKERQFSQVDLPLFLSMLQELAMTRPNTKIRLVGIGVGYGEHSKEQLELFT